MSYPPRPHPKRPLVREDLLPGGHAGQCGACHRTKIVFDLEVSQGDGDGEKKFTVFLCRRCGQRPDAHLRIKGAVERAEHLLPIYAKPPERPWTERGPC